MIEVKQVDYGSPGPLERLIEQVGGRIYPAYNSNCRRRWYLAGSEAATLARQIYDLMSERRQQQIRAMLSANTRTMPVRPQRRVPAIALHWEQWRRDHPNCKQHGIPRTECLRCAGGGQTKAPVLATGQK